MSLVWSGRNWTPRLGAGDPGPNDFLPANAAIVGGKLQLSITHDGPWYSTEIRGQNSYGYGRYRWVINTDLSDLDQQIMLTLGVNDAFVSSAAPLYGRESKIEFGNKGAAVNNNVWATVAPYALDTARLGFGQVTDQPPYTCDMIWQPGGLYFLCRDRLGRIFMRHYCNDGVQEPGNENVVLQLWLWNNDPPLDGLPVTVEIASFSFRSGVVFAPLSFESFGENFAGTSVPLTWYNETIAAITGHSFTGEKLTIPCNTPYMKIDGPQVFSLLSSSAFVEVLEVPAAGPTEGQFVVWHDDSNQILMDKTGGVGAEVLLMQVTENGVTNELSVPWASGVAVPPFSGLVDEFIGDTLGSARWSGGSYGTVVVSGGSVNLSAAASAGGYSGFTSGNYALQGSHVDVEISNASWTGLLTGSHEFIMEVVDTSASNNKLSFILSGGAFVQRSTVAGAQTNNPAPVSFDPTNHRFWRIAEAGGTVTFAVSPDGSTWTTLWTLSMPAWVPGSCYLNVMCGHYTVPEAIATTLRVESVNHGGTPYTAGPTQHRWWRIVESSGVITFQTSPTGTSWNTQGSVPHSMATKLSDVRPRFTCGRYGAGTGQFVVDNFNGGIAVVAPPIEPEPGAVAPAARGTVYGVAVRPGEPAPTPPQIPVPYAATNPHFAMPFAFSGSDFAVNEQDSPEEIMACEEVIARCPVGALTERPDFGIPWPEFKNIPIDTRGIDAALRRLEPRGKTTFEQWQDMVELGVAHINVNVEVER